MMKATNTLLNLGLLNDMPVSLVERLTNIAINNKIHGGLIIEDGKIKGAVEYEENNV